MWIKENASNCVLVIRGILGGALEGSVTSTYVLTRYEVRGTGYWVLLPSGSSYLYYLYCFYVLDYGVPDNPFPLSHESHPCHQNSPRCS
jgi:hypothetical protein